MQWNNPIQGDWVPLIKIDLHDFDLPYHLDWVSSKAKETFKRIVKEQATTSTLQESSGNVDFYTT